MKEVAKCIVDPVPRWLPEVLSDWSFDVSSQDSIDKMWPTRREMWDSLAKANSACQELSNLLKNPAVAGFLVTNSKVTSQKLIDDFIDHLSTFIGFTAEACRSPLLIGINSKVLSGAGKALLPGVMPAKYVCAAIISEVIDFFANKEARKPSKQKPNLAAERFWTAWPDQREKGLRTNPAKQ